jgi:glycosyltransferase 2 family protein
MKKPLLICIIIGVIGFYCYNTIKQISPQDYKDIVNQLNPMWIFYLCFSIGSFYFSTLSWYYLLPKINRKNIPFFHLFMIRQVGDTFALLNPTGVLAGDYLKYKMISKYDDMDEKTILRSLIDFRYYAIVSFIILAIITLIPFLYNHMIMNDWSIYIIITIVLAVIMLYLLISRVSTSQFITSFEKRKTKTNNPYAIKIYGALITFLTMISEANFHPRMWNKKSFIAASIHWLIGGIETYFIFLMMSQTISIYDSLLIENGIMVVKSLGSIIPGQIGIEELGNKIMLSIFATTSGAIWLGYSILRRMRFLFWIIVSGIYVLPQLFQQKNKLNPIITKIAS